MGVGGCIISVFIPVYNEEEIIEDSLKKIIKEMKNIGRNFEIIVVNDGSTDRTYEIIESIPHVIARHYAGPSRRENLADSFFHSGSEIGADNIIIFMDSDLSVPLKHVKDLLKELDDGADIVVGSKYSGIKATRSFYRRFFSVMYNFVIRTMFQSKIKDHNCGFKAFRREMLAIISEMGHNSVRGWFWDAEFLIRAQKLGCDVREIPVDWTRAEKSTFSLKREIKLIPYMIKLRFRI